VVENMVGERRRKDREPQRKVRQLRSANYVMRRLHYVQQSLTFRFFLVCALLAYIAYKLG